MLKPGFLLQVLPVVAIILAAFVFILFKMLSRLKPRDDVNPTGAWFNEALLKEKTAPELRKIKGSYPVSIHSEHGSFNAEAKEISLSGAFIICDQPLPVGEKLGLTLKLTEPLELQAAVTWNNCNVPREEVVVSGMRVRFLDVPAEARAALLEQPPEKKSKRAAEHIGD